MKIRNFTQSEIRAKQRIKKLYDEFGTWRKVADQVKLPARTVRRIALDNSYFPQRPDIRSLLGVETYALAPVCPKCQRIHLTARCKKKKKVKSLIDIPTNILRQLIINREEF